jgi:hypothetical protein
MLEDYLCDGETRLYLTAILNFPAAPFGLSLLDSVARDDVSPSPSFSSKSSDESFLTGIDFLAGSDPGDSIDPYLLESVFPPLRVSFFLRDGTFMVEPYFKEGDLLRIDDCSPSSSMVSSATISVGSSF